MEHLTQVYDLSDPATKRELMKSIGSLSGGLYEVTIKKRRKTRSLEQNRYYFACIVSPFCQYLRENYGDPTITLEQAHDMLARAVLGVKELMNKSTGEVIDIRPSTSILDVEEFTVYVDKCAVWLQGFADITTLTKEDYFDKDAQ
jgi:hypothetical protein